MGESNISLIRNAKKRRGHWGIFIFVLAVLFCFYPYEFSSFYLRFLPTKTYITASVLLIVSFFCLKLIKGKISLTRGLQLVLMMQFVGYYLVGLAHLNLLPAIGITPFILLAIILISIIESSIGLTEFFRRYNRWILLMAVFGVLAWFLVTFFGFGPISLAADRTEDHYIANYGLTFSKYKEFMAVGGMRYAGFFDEPGAIAYWGIFALVFNKLFINDRRLEILLAVCLTLTFSMGYYLQLLAYLFFFTLGKLKPGQIVMTVAIVGVILFGLYNTKETELNAVYNMTFGRFEDYEEQANANGIEVGNRAVLTANAKKVFHENVLFGSDVPEGINVGNNIYEPLALYGIVGCFFVYFPFLYFLYVGIKKKNRDIWGCAIVLLLGCLHRPFHSNVLSFFILYSLISMCVQYSEHRIYLANYEGGR